MSVTTGLLLIIGLGIIFVVVGILALKSSAPAGYIFLAIGIIFLLSVIIKYVWK
ncbi:MAG: hypothetical protein KKA79_01360 [Nanoarchaeota archaeon]|nr:hypothetical protein [Nanoarchaeota archaeon]